MTILTRSIEIRPIAPAVVSALRDRDDAGRRPRLVTETDGGSPLRCCLRPSRAGEQLALVSYAPLRRWAAETAANPGPYDEVGPVFIHAEHCDGPVSEAFPAGLFAAHRMFRKYDATGAIVGGQLVQPDESPQAVLDEIFATEPAVALVHVRAVEFGCFLFEARPSESGATIDE
jgi:hypothetical protein